MKRSEINSLIRDAMSFFAEHNFKLPPFAYFEPAEWVQCRAQAQEIFELQLGWDITTFGGNDFARMGLLLFTLRNGCAGSVEYPKPYAEKIMIVRENQITPRHFHWYKREDIINRGGGNLVIELFRADPQRNCLGDGEFPISVNGMRQVMASGARLVLRPGDSACLEPIHAHRFFGEPGFGKVLVGEVSMVNDDANDNCFVDGMPRFDPIEEDEAPACLLASDYKNMVI